MRIAVCDDQKTCIIEINRFIDKFQKDRREEMEVINFRNGNELLDYYYKYPQIDIVILDILMKGLSGIEVARELRKRDLKIQIIFLTATKEYTLEGYEVEASSYLLKPVKYEAFRRVLDRTIEKCHKSVDQFITLKKNGQFYIIDQDDISYMEMDNRKTVIHANKHKYETYRSLKGYEKDLNPLKFGRCHAAFIVNFRYITNVGSDFVELKDETRIPISKNKRKSFMQKLAIYMGKQSVQIN